MPWAALGTAVAGLGAAAWNYLSNREQNDRNLEQWQRENAYNLPINQVSRLKMAGLNPSLMYKNGVDGLTSASSPDMQGNGLIDPVSASQIALNSAQATAISDANDRENEKQGITVETMNHIKEQNRVMIDLLNNQNTKTHWESEYMRLLGDSESWRSKMLFQDWYSGFRTLNKRIENMLVRLDEDSSRAVFQKDQQEYEFGAKFVEYNSFPYLLRNSISQGVAMINNINSSTYSNYQNVNIGWFNADTSRMNAYSNAWNAQTNEYNMMANVNYTAGLLRKLSAETEALRNSNSIFEYTKYAKIAGEYTGAIGNFFGVKLGFSTIK